MTMRMEDLSMALVATLHDLTAARALDWRLVQSPIQPAPGAVASPSQFEVVHKGARFLLFEEEQHRLHPDLGTDVWLKRHVLAMYDEQGRELWHAADAFLGVSHLHRAVSSQVLRIDEVLKTLIEPDTLQRYAGLHRSPFTVPSSAMFKHRRRRAWLQRLWLSFVERFYWRDLLGARERLVRRRTKSAAHA